ncbi:hypothetical protein EV188_102482 [Actinomycetospora succinea]|uniref:Uncharacterized protein n=1 Tax=Actinomycetospora succinea TaxID=663603 RepID=A0A4R6VJ23_9PSEU|nr:hypothetical protein [Actinomycetospora succinea]TDQ62826.1 hypothetical protein EV188_102482 [Actinomycetospora succinea]
MSPANPEEKTASASAGIGLTFPQIIASALAAATAAILGSFMGVLGTIGGAAVASIISTVGSALYQKSLEVTRDRVKERLVVAGPNNTRIATAVGKVAGGAAGAAGARSAQAPVQQPAPPGRPPVGPPTPGPGVPVPPGQRQVRPGMPPADPTRRVPGAAGPPTGRPGQPGQPVHPGRVALRHEGADPTRVHARVDPNGPATSLAPGAPGAPTEARPTAFIPQSRQTGTPPGGGPTAVMGQPGRPTGPGGPGGPGGPPLGPDDAVTTVAPLEPEPARRGINWAGMLAALKGLGWKTWVTLGGVAASVFVIALIATFGVETAAGHPLSGGSSGTSVGSLFGQETGTSEATTAPSDSSTEETTAPDSTTTSRTQQEEQGGTGGTGTQQPDTSTSQPTRSSQSGGLPNLLPRDSGSGSGGGSTNG